jgi:hypothetical protein
LTVCRVNISEFYIPPPPALDKVKSTELDTGTLLGKGGFAKVYKVRLGANWYAYKKFDKIFKEV